MQKNIIKKFVDAIDDLNIVRKAFRVLYYVMGIIMGLMPLVFVLGMFGSVFAFLSPIGRLLSDVGIGSRSFEGWPNFVFWLMMSLWVVGDMFLCVACFKYWKKHGDDIVNVKNRYPNITFVADFLHTSNNSYVFVNLCSTALFVVLAYLFMALTGEFNFYKGGNFLLYLLGAVALVIVYAIILLLQILAVSFITELLKRKIQIATDLQDVADVVRASEITKQE